MTEQFTSQGAEEIVTADVYRAACEQERRLWKEVAGKYPGQPGYDAERWAEWNFAANQVNALARLIRSRRSA